MVKVWIINKDYENVRGITLSLNKRFLDHYSIDLNYTYQVAEGSNSTPEDAFNAQKGNNEPQIYLIPVNWDQRHLLNVSLYVGDVDWGISLLGRYGTGMPYTPSISQFTAERGITSALTTNSRTKPAQFVMDLKATKSIKINTLDFTLFVNVTNILDARIITNVYTDTGESDFTGATQDIGSDPRRPNTITQYLNKPMNYGEPRNIQFGLELSF